ncbi:MAG: biotin/lipoyl-containing protein [Chloroflexota bacterium]|nr:biotin/lipoyl-containing protein [Chloroflexota bacterium]
MRSFRVNVGDATYLVEVEDAKRSPIKVKVNGKDFEVDVEWQGAAAEATVTPELVPADPSQHTTVPGTGRPPLPPRPHLSEEERQSVQSVDAPMPGTILSLSVKVGDEIERGDEICVLEAMKMQNSIKAPRSGKIAEIAVIPGSRVSYGDPLVRFS